MKTLFKILCFIMFIPACTGQNDPVYKIPTDATPIKLTVAQQNRVGQDNEFAFDLLKNSISTSGETNVFISPLSVSIALGMAWNGAVGTTKTEMETALKMSGMSVDDINSYYKIMQSTLPGIDPTSKLSIANSLWYRTGFAVKPAYLQVNKDYFNAYVKELDFSQAWAVDTINNWCSAKTNKMIPKVLDNIPSDIVMYLINAEYFKGIWRKKFDKTQTTLSSFTNELGNQVNVNMMYQKDTFAYSVDNYAQYLDMPYGNKAFSMTVILPVDGKTNADVLNYLTAEKFNSILGYMPTKKVEVHMPRFNTKNDLNMIPPLQNMGMKQAFTDFADFSNIADAQLLISTIKHITNIEVTEEGTEAAAVTIIGVGVTSMPVDPDPVFRVNKPFLFVIREKSTGVILFMGKMGTVEKF
ncbi:MAG: serpin family protein [Paludibacter sp.]